MARITKVELEQQLMCKGKELAAAREEISTLRAEVERLERAQGVATPAPAPRVYTPRALPAHMQAAKEAAMRLGRVVRVEM